MIVPSSVPRLTDIIDAIELIRSEMAGVSLRAFEPDRRKRWLVERGIEIISEASRHLGDSMKARHPEIPWPKVAAIGNVLRHEYEQVAHDVLWHVVRDDLPQLEKACREELAREPGAEAAGPSDMRQSDGDDPYNLGRFVDVQDPVFDRVRAELRRGRKESHWMWFVFPQFEGLGSSAMARRYAIASRAEAKADLEHKVLGPRLRECTRLVNAIEGLTIGDIFGHPDDLKFRSSMTLFAQVAADNGVFVEALRKYFAGAADRATLERLGGEGGS